MLSDTLSAGLAQYRIGPKVRTLRQDKKLGLVQLGQHTGLSPAMLSKIERGQLFPTLPTLLRIALVFGVGLEHFFVETTEQPLHVVVRKSDRLKLPNDPDSQPPAYLYESLDYPVQNRVIEAYYAEFSNSDEPSDPHSHDGVEFVYVIDGQLVIDVDGATSRLDPGDAISFDSSVDHTYQSRGNATCSAIVVVAAPHSK